MIEEKKGFLTFIIHKIVVYLNIFYILSKTILYIWRLLIHEILLYSRSIQLPRRIAKFVLQVSVEDHYRTLSLEISHETGDADFGQD